MDVPEQNFVTSYQVNKQTP